jgi:hypothetical protein
MMILKYIPLAKVVTICFLLSQTGQNFDQQPLLIGKYWEVWGDC